jgi:hypothetical protein
MSRCLDLPRDINVLLWVIFFGFQPLTQGMFAPCAGIDRGGVGPPRLPFSKCLDYSFDLVSCSIPLVLGERSRLSFLVQFPDLNK